MPTVLRIGPYPFHFYSREENEPPHIHVTREETEAKFWLHSVSLAANRGFAPVGGFAHPTARRRALPDFNQRLY